MAFFTLPFPDYRRRKQRDLAVSKGVRVAPQRRVEGHFCRGCEKGSSLFLLDLETTRGNRFLFVLLAAIFFLRARVEGLLNSSGSRRSST